MEELRVATDFSGLGSPEEALKRLNVPHRVVFACEWDKYARASYEANHGPEIFYEDITKRDNKTAPTSDIYVFGFPCQAFSIAGKQKGFEDTRGTLFFNSLEYIDKKRPRVFIAENVKGLLSHDSGKTFRTIIDCLATSENGQQNLYPKLDCVGYHIFYAVHNTKNFGIPQNRERIFIVGFRDQEDASSFKQPNKIPLFLKLKDMLQDNPDYLRISREVRSEEGKRIRAQNLKDGRDYNPQRAKELIFEDKDIANTITTTLTKDNMLMVDRVGPFYDVPEKYYLSDKMLEGLIRHTESHNEKGNGFKFEPTEGDTVSKCVTARVFKMGVDDNYIAVQEPTMKIIGEVNSSQDGKVFDVNGISQCLSAGHGNSPKILVNEATKQGYAVAHEGDSINLAVPTSKTRRGRVGASMANTLDTQCNQGVVVGGLIPLFGSEKKSQGERIYSDEGISVTLSSNGGGLGAKTGLYKTGVRIRRLTPRECFRLQGYTDEFFDKCAEVNSDTQLYKQAGNSITVDTIMYLIKNILIAIKYL